MPNMKSNLLIRFLNILLIINALTAFFILGYFVGSKDIALITNKYATHPGTETNCTNMTLEETVRCLQSDFSSWYIFNMDNWNVTMNESTFKKEGGVCGHAANWYVTKAKQLGFYAKEIKFWGDLDLGHDIALIYDANLTGYCIVDQNILYNCVTLDLGVTS